MKRFSSERHHSPTRLVWIISIFILTAVLPVFICIQISCGKSDDKNTVSPALKERYIRARTLYLKGSASEARESFEEIYLADPSYRENSTAYIRCLLYDGDPAAALRTARRLPGNLLEESVDLIRITAESAMLLESFDEAELLLERGIRISSEDTGLLLLLARCRRAQGRLDEALTLLEAARLLAERDVEIFTEIARIYAACGMEQQAIHALESGLVRLSPGHPLEEALREALAELNSR